MNAIEKKIAILVDNYFEQSEFEVPLRELESSGAEVTIVGTDKKELQALKHIKLGDTFKANLLIADTDPDMFNGLILPGGVFNADHLRMLPKARDWIDHFMDNDKLIAAICHAPWLLVSADVVEGRRLTSYYTLQDDIRNAGGEWVDQPVVIDRNLITSRKPDDLPAFTQAIKAWFDMDKAIVS